MTAVFFERINVDDDLPECPAYVSVFRSLSARASECFSASHWSFRRALWLQIIHCFTQSENLSQTPVHECSSFWQCKVCVYCVLVDHWKCKTFGCSLSMSMIRCPVMILQSFHSLISNNASFHCISLDLPSIFVSFLQLMMKKIIKKAILHLCRWNALRKIFLPVPGGICILTRHYLFMKVSV